MKIAGLLSGEPRFCEDFDIQLSNFTNFNKVDWYFFIWKNNEEPHKTNINVVSQFWKKINYDSAYEKIQKNLPLNHSIKSLCVVDKKKYQINFEPKNKYHGVHADNVWLKFQGHYNVNEEFKKSDIDYDLVIITRPDILIEPKIDFYEIKKILDVNKNCIIVPNNWEHGYIKKINDSFAIATPDIMNIYCNLINYIPKLQKENFLFHPETMLAEYLHRNNINIIKGNFSMHLRSLGTKNSDWHYISKFGKWN